MPEVYVLLLQPYMSTFLLYLISVQVGYMDKYLYKVYRSDTCPLSKYLYKVYHCTCLTICTKSTGQIHL